jgi:hypothetical protein
MKTKRKLIWIEETEKEHLKRKKKAIDLSMKLEKYYSEMIKKGETK